jgi:hypothetical protein
MHSSIELPPSVSAVERPATPREFAEDLLFKVMMPEPVTFLLRASDLLDQEDWSGLREIGLDAAFSALGRHFEQTDNLIARNNVTVAEDSWNKLGMRAAAEVVAERPHERLSEDERLEREKILRDEIKSCLRFIRVALENERARV